jgi:predicted glycoside hydrolase/deacetylase ChbG (UPF0249 family)
VIEKGRQLGVPVRHVMPPIFYLGDFYGQDEKGDSYQDHVSVAFLVALIRGLPEGTTELCCHPAEVVDFDATYGAERVMELAALCDPAVIAAVREADVELRSFGGMTADRG